MLDKGGKETDFRILSKNRTKRKKLEGLKLTNGEVFTKNKKMKRKKIWKG